MVSSLDPHSSYMDAKTFADMQIQTSGEFGGLGLEVTMEDGLVKVVSPIDDTPAAKAGIKTGDFIAAIDGTPIQGMSLDDAIDKMRGADGTKVTLTMLRIGAKKPFDVALTRAHRRRSTEREVSPRRRRRLYPPARHSTSRRGIGPRSMRCVELKQPDRPGHQRLCSRPAQQSGRPARSGRRRVRRFPEVRRDRVDARASSRRHEALRRQGGDITDGKPVVVLINGGTASASEIVAGALQDNKRATIEGMTSFGKGSVQTIIPLVEGGGALRLTTARYYTPSGHSIQAAGIVPDVAVAQGDEDRYAARSTHLSEADLAGHLHRRKRTRRRTSRRSSIRRRARRYDDFQLSYALDLAARQD